jgi:hypothetical protein
MGFLKVAGVIAAFGVLGLAGFAAINWLVGRAAPIGASPIPISADQSPSSPDQAVAKANADADAAMADSNAMVAAAENPAPTETAAAAPVDADWYIVAPRVNACIRAAPVYGTSDIDAMIALVEAVNGPQKVALRDETRVLVCAVANPDACMAFMRGKAACEQHLAGEAAATQNQ